MRTIRNRTTKDGHKLGEVMAKYCDEAEPLARLKVPGLPPRCQSCAFRKGSHLASGSPATQMDALKCVVEGEVFECHQHGRENMPCSGWAMLVLAKSNDEILGKVPWDFFGGTDSSQADPALPK